jgi:signal peptidase II
MPWLEPALAAAGVLAADQFSKHLVLAQPRFCDASAKRAFLAIRCVVNKRGAVLPRMRRAWRIAAFVLCAVLALVVLVQEPFARNPLGAAGIGMALGGIAGNFIDLMWRDGVVDFIAVGSRSVFNIADVAIVGGLALALWALV